MTSSDEVNNDATDAIDDGDPNWPQQDIYYNGGSGVYAFLEERGHT
jgi:hypothetical protein